MPAYAAPPYRDSSTGVLLFQLKGAVKGTYYFRFALPGGGKWYEGNTRVSGPISNPCQPPSTAIAVAVAEWNRVQGQLRTGSTVTKAHTIKEAAQRYLDDLESAHSAGKVSDDRLKNRGGFIRNYVLPYSPFEKATLNSFDENALQSFSDHCIGDKHPAASTVDKWGIYLGEVFSKAITLKWLPKTERPITKFIVEGKELAEGTQTPQFTEAEWALMEAAIPEFLGAIYLSDYDKLLRRLVVLMSEVCYAYGLRVGEAIRLYWPFVRPQTEGERTFIVLDVPTPLKGHREHIRTAIPLEWWEDRVKIIFDVELPAYFADCDLKRLGLLFQRPDGKPASNLANTFDKWLEVAKVKSNFGKHAMTSFRHTHINELISRTTLGDGTIADLAGTSVDMIRRHYRKAYAIRHIENERRQRNLMKMLEDHHKAAEASKKEREPKPEEPQDPSTAFNPLNYRDPIVRIDLDD